MKIDGSELPSRLSKISPMPEKPALTCHPLGADRWADFESLFGKNGACGGCWCTTWRQPRAKFNRNKGEGNRRFILHVVQSGEPPGILGYLNGEPVGWCAVARRRLSFSGTVTDITASGRYAGVVDFMLLHSQGPAKKGADAATAPRGRRLREVARRQSRRGLSGRAEIEQHAFGIRMDGLRVRISCGGVQGNRPAVGDSADHASTCNKPGTSRSDSLV